jgi:hypothetical protein
MAVRDRDRPGWTRRAMLGAAGGAAVAGAVAGCSWLGTDPPRPPPPDPLEPLLATTQALAARYQRVLATHPDLAGRLRPLHQAHLAHLEALLAVIGRPELATPAAGTWAPPLDRTPGPGPASPAGPADPVAGLREAEWAARAEASQACLTAPPERAALLGSITAARATHAEVLDAPG